MLRVNTCLFFKFYTTYPMVTSLHSAVRGCRAGVWLLTGLLLLVGAGCVSPRKVIYFQSLSVGAAPAVQMAEAYVPLIRPGDVLSIQVSSLSAEASVIFNPYAQMSMTNVRPNQPINTGGVPEMAGYLVSPSGQIELPLLGEVTVGQLTLSEASRQIRDKLKTYLKEPTVNLRNLNFRVSVLGEVARPSLFTVPNDRITLIEALSLAGDATIYGRRDNVLVVREEGGRKTFARIDLTSQSLFQSPFYYLHPNDVIYVEPTRSRIANSDQFYQVVIPSVLSALSILALILTRN
jgi:polysaccharide biosynthesis/export protein